MTYLGTEWAGNPVVRSDLRVDYLLRSMGGHQWPERRDKLLEVLDVDINWRMHQVSDGTWHLFVKYPDCHIKTVMSCELALMYRLCSRYRRETARPARHGSNATLGSAVTG